MVLQHRLFASAYSDESEKLIVFYQAAVELFRHPDIVPVLAVVAVFDQRLDLMSTQSPVSLCTLTELFVSQVPFIFSFRKKFWTDKTFTDVLCRSDFYVIHF